MGDRVSIRFVNGDSSSPVLFNHWGGKAFVKVAVSYVKELHEELVENDSRNTYPLDRLEPQTVMVDFIRYLTTGYERVRSNLYLGVSPDDGDNSDNGHWDVLLEGTKVKLRRR